MLDRERSPYSNAVANGGVDNQIGDNVDDLLEAKLPRTTIVPGPFDPPGLLDDELESENTRKHSALLQQTLRKFGLDELDDPDLLDAEADEPTLIGNSLSGTANDAGKDRKGNSRDRGESKNAIQQTGEHPVAPVRPLAAAPPARPQAMPRSLPPPVSKRPPAISKTIVSPPQFSRPPVAPTIPAPPKHLHARETSDGSHHLVAHVEVPRQLLAQGDSEHQHARSDNARSDNARSDNAGPDNARSDKWYLRVQLNTDCVADLWVRDLTPHNVLVWSDDMQSWVPLLTVRELRDAIREAHDAKTRDQLRESNFVFVATNAPSVDQQPLPKPRLPAAMETMPAPVPTSHWALPKPRTISNVPPPLLTTAVPVLGDVEPQHSESQVSRPPRMSLSLLAELTHPHQQRPPAPPRQQPQSHAPQLQLPPLSSSVPPVVTPVEAIPDQYVEAISLPDIPGPARVPAVLPNHALALVQRPLPPDRISRSQPPPLPRRRALLPSIPLVHVERLLWLAAGIAVTAATMLILRDGGRDRDSDQSAAMGTPVAVAANGVNARPTVPESTPAGQSQNASRPLDVHRLEELPLVGSTTGNAASSNLASGSASNNANTAVSNASATSLAPATSNASKATHGATTTKGKTKGGAVAPLPVQLASTPGESVPAATKSAASSGGGFDTAAARRVLTSAASRAGRCQSDGSASGSVLVTFAPTGFVQSASISGISGKGVNVGCVLRAFQEARLSPFNGAAVTVRKGFQIL